MFGGSIWSSVDAEGIVHKLSSGGRTLFLFIDFIFFYFFCNTLTIDLM